MLVVCLIAGIGIPVSVELSKNSGVPTAGVWWWHENLDTETYLNFAVDNGINEIYYHASEFDENTKTFVSNAKQNKVKVYWLAGKHQWLNDPTQLFEQIDDYLAYQKANPKAQFCGIHLDIEPHQNPDFEENRYDLIYNLIDLANTLKKTYPKIKFDYDLPFWLEDEISYNGKTKPAYEFMIDIANRIFVMSYRDTAEGILDVAEEEIAYAKQKNKGLILCVETSETSEEEFVSFFEEGKKVLQEELEKVKAEIPKTFGISIHHIRSWFELKD